MEYFVAVAKESSFTRAAARVHVAQPGVSAQIRRLERELGEELLDRSGRSVRLTEAGAAVLPYAQAALAAVAGARLAIDELTGLMRGHVTIGTVTSISSEDVDLPGLLSDFHHDYPAVEITLTVGNSDHLVQALQAGQIDIAFVGLGTAAAPPGIRTHIVISEPLVAVVSQNDPLAMKTTITLKALSERKLISLPRGTGLRACLDEVCAALGFEPHIAFEAGDPRVVAELAVRGLGVAIVPHSVARARCKQLHNIAITRPELWGRIALAWRTDKPISPATRALISRAQTVLPDPTKDHLEPPRVR